jgi:multidrug efflux system outer membrane protein
MYNKNKLGIFLLLILFIQSCAPSLQTIKKESTILESIPKEYPTYKNDKEVKKEGEVSKEIEADAKNQENTAMKLWQEFFQDEKLKSLVETALKNNKELNIVDQEINIADNEIMGRRGEYLPSLGFGASYESEKVGKYTHQGASDETTEYEPGKTVPENLHNHKIGLYASWELDIWGKLRNATKSAYFEYLATMEGKKYLVTGLVAEVASTYYELLALDRQLDIVKNYIDILQRAQALVSAQLQAAKVTSLAVKRFEAEVLKNQSRQFEITQLIVENENKLNLLLGRFPQKIERDSERFLDIIPMKVSSGVPTDLLVNRPDVKQSMMELESAKLDVQVAKKRFYPSLSIEAGGGYEAFNKEHLYKAPESIFYNLGVNLTAPLLNRNAIKADYYSANNKQIQAIYHYEYTLIKAYTDVVNQLSKITNLNTVYLMKTKQVQALTASAEISTLLFKNARVDYVESLMTQRDSLEAQVELVEIKKNQLISYIYLYKALGGGWANIEKVIKG